MKSIAVLVLPALLPAAPLHAQETPPADLAALLQEADSASPVLRAAAARLEAARLRPPQARALPDPEASLGYTNEGTDRFTLGEAEDARLSFAFRQELPYPGKRDAAGEVAAHAAEVAARELERLRLEIRAGVESSFADLFRLDRSTAVLREMRAVLDTFAQVARRRYEAGEGVQESILKAETEILRLDTDLERALQERRAAEVRLLETLGRDGGPGIGTVTALPAPPIPADLEELAAEAAASSPAVAALEAAVLREEAAVRRARLDLKPDFVWSASYDHRAGLEPMLGGMIGLRLPLYRRDKQAQALLEAESTLRAARHDLEQGRLAARAGALDLAARVRRADRLVRLIGAGVIPQAAAALESARTSYSVGRLPFLDVLNDLRVLLEARIDLAAEEADRLQALAALEPLVGRPLVLDSGPVPDGPSREGGSDARDR
ncbi:MAG: TolC family protein [Candidatus Polarisedimenticolia bacterium]